MTDDTGTGNGAAAPPLGGVARRDDVLPLAFRFGDDFLLHLMTVDPRATARDACAAAAGFVAGRRVPVTSGDLIMYYEGRAVDPDQEVRELGIGWLEYVEISVEE